MRVLFLTHRIPFPPNKGDKIRSFHILDYLSRRHEVYVGCLVDEASDLDHLPRIRNSVRGLVFEQIRPNWRKFLALRAVVARRPITTAYFYCRGFQRQIDALLDEVPVDAVVCFSSPMAEYVFGSRHAQGLLARATRVMDLIDVDSRKWEQLAVQGSPWQAPIYRYEARYLAEYERRIARTFDRVLVVSEEERRVFPGQGNSEKVEVVSNGVDLEFFRPPTLPNGMADHPTVVFTGMMDYWPNIDGVTWFVNDILPRIRVAVPDVEFLIVGAKPTREVGRLGGRDGVTVTGFVDDVRGYLVRAHVCVAPLRLARGIQNKVLEAMAMGKAVVSTPQAFEGIRAVSGEDLVVADGAEVFAAAVTSLLRDSPRAGAIGARARQCVEARYSWEGNLEALDRILGGKSAAVGDDAAITVAHPGETAAVQRAGTG